MSDRDPRTNPQKGDVLRKEGPVRQEVRRIVEVTTSAIAYHQDGIWGRMHETREDWDDWAEDAEVVTGEG